MKTVAKLMGDRHPILFSTPMIHAILEGRKTQTRRIVNPQPKATRLIAPVESILWNEPEARWLAWRHPYGGFTRSGEAWRCPFGAAGDRLWVRETFGIIKGNGIRTVYRADGDPPPPILGTPEKNGVRKRKWTPSIFMRPAQSRITLEVTDVRVERLHAITELDAEAEGMRSFCACDCSQPTFREGFARGWDKINGKRGPWKTNPFVWVVSFKRAS